MLKKYKFAATPLYGSSCIDDIEKIFLDDLTQLDMYGRRRDDSSSHQTIVCSVHVHPTLFAFPPFTVNYYSRRERLHILNYNTCLSLVLNLFLGQLYPCSIRKTLILKALIEVVQVARDSEYTKDAKTRPNFSLLCQRKNSL